MIFLKFCHEHLIYKEKIISLPKEVGYSQVSTSEQYFLLKVWQSFYEQLIKYGYDSY